MGSELVDLAVLLLVLLVGAVVAEKPTPTAQPRIPTFATRLPESIKEAEAKPYALKKFSLPYDPFDAKDAKKMAAYKAKLLTLSLEARKLAEKLGPDAMLSALFSKVNMSNSLDSSSIEQIFQIFDVMALNSTNIRKPTHHKLDVVDKVRASERLTQPKAKRDADHARSLRRDAPPPKFMFGLPELADDVDDVAGGDASRSRKRSQWPRQVAVDPKNVRSKPLALAKALFYTRSGQLRADADGPQRVYPRIDGESREFRLTKPRKPDVEIRRAPQKPSAPMRHRSPRLQPVNREDVMRDIPRAVKPPNPKSNRRPPVQSRREVERIPATATLRANPERRRSPMRATFNDKVFQLLNEYGVSAMRVETDDFSVRAFADPRKTRFLPVRGPTGRPSRSRPGKRRGESLPSGPQLLLIGPEDITTGSHRNPQVEVSPATSKAMRRAKKARHPPTRILPIMRVEQRIL